MLITQVRDVFTWYTIQIDVNSRAPDQLQDAPPVINKDDVSGMWWFIWKIIKS